MAAVTLLVRIDNPNQRHVAEMLDSLNAQTFQDWEVIFLVREEDEVTPPFHPKAWTYHYQNQMMVESLNTIRDTLGGWVGFMGQHDKLDPECLERIVSAGLGRQLVYTDAVRFSRWGIISYQEPKPPLNTVRLKYHNCLRDLTLVRSQVIRELGFDPQCSDDPMHDLILRALESHGSTGVAHVREPLYRRRRNALEPYRDPRDPEYIPSYDLQAIRNGFRRNGKEVAVEQVNGIPSVGFLNPRYPSLLALVLADDDIEMTVMALQAIKRELLYPNLKIRGTFTGKNLDCMLATQALFEDARVPLKAVLGGNEAQLVNEAIAPMDCDLTLLLRAQPSGKSWLRKMVAELQGLDAVAIGPRTFYGWNLHFHSFGHRYQGMDWNHRGRFSALSTPQKVSMLNPDCLLLKTRETVNLGGMDPEFHTQYALDFTMRLQNLNRRVVWTPTMTAFVRKVEVSDEERQVLIGKWKGWEDPFELSFLV